jgi:hypothetical protein
LLSRYQPNKTYKVERRFNDFKNLYLALKEVEEYKGLSIPPLPESTPSLKSFIKHDD